MANATASYGFVYVKSLYGPEPPNIECAALTAASDLYVGDPVKLSGTGDSQGRPSITKADAGDMVFGVVEGFKATGPDNLNKMYSDSADTVMVKPALPGVVFRVNGGSVASNGASLNDIGLRFDHIDAAGSSLDGKSGFYLDMGGTTAGSSTENQWLLIGFDRRPDNEFSTTVGTDTDNVDLLVVCLESTLSQDGTGA
jgi:hypothetical protein